MINITHFINKLLYENKKDEYYSLDNQKLFKFDMDDDASDSLNKNNSRLKKIYNFNLKYADDVYCEINSNKIYINLHLFKLIKTKEGFTSVVHIYSFENEMIIKKIYKKRKKNENYYVDDNFIKESFYNELESLTMLQNELYFPKLICYNEEEMSITMNYVGEILNKDKKDIDLSKIPKNWKEQLYYILVILKKYNLYHNDVTERNLCLLNNRITLIDYGNCKHHIDTYYRNYNINLLSNSENIIHFLSDINKNSLLQRYCLHGFN